MKILKYVTSVERGTEAEELIASVDALFSRLDALAQRRDPAAKGEPGVWMVNEAGNELWIGLGAAGWVLMHCEYLAQQLSWQRLALGDVQRTGDTAFYWDQWTLIPNRHLLDVTPAKQQIAYWFERGAFSPDLACDES